MFLGLILIIFTGVLLYFGWPLRGKIEDKLDRVLVSVLLILSSCFGAVWGCTALVEERMFPTITRGISDDYSFTMQPYGMAFTSSQGYNLVFYRNRSFWFNQELGKIQLECIGREAIAADIIPIRSNMSHLLIKADNSTVLDTILSCDQPFDFKHSIID